MIEPTTTPIPTLTPSDQSGSSVANTPTAPKESSGAAQKTATQPEEPSVRLVIEPARNGESFTYKLFDRISGRLLIELPREQAATLGESQDYTVGQVISTKA